MPTLGTRIIGNVVTECNPNTGVPSTFLNCGISHPLLVSFFAHFHLDLDRQLGKPSLKKNIFLLTFVNKDFTPPLIIEKKTIEVRGAGPFIKVKNNIV